MNMISTNTALDEKHVYWMGKQNLNDLKKALPAKLKLKAALMTPCEAMKATGNTAFYVSPDVWTRICARQGSWYGGSRKNGEYMVVSAKALPRDYDAFLR